jgi:hypothetical protein
MVIVSSRRPAIALFSSMFAASPGSAAAVPRIRQYRCRPAKNHDCMNTVGGVWLASAHDIPCLVYPCLVQHCSLLVRNGSGPPSHLLHA